MIDDQLSCDYILSILFRDEVPDPQIIPGSALGIIDSHREIRRGIQGWPPPKFLS
jgi:hypothetical protein